MLAGAPHEAGWLRAEPSRTCARSLRERVVQTVFPRCYVANIQPLTDGLRNANFKLQLDCTAELIVPLI